MADAEGLNPSDPSGSCGFDSRPGHHDANSSHSWTPLALSYSVADKPIARPWRKMVTGPSSLTTAMVVDGWS